MRFIKAMVRPREYNCRSSPESMKKSAWIRRPTPLATRNSRAQCGAAYKVAEVHAEVPPLADFGQVAAQREICCPQNPSYHGLARHPTPYPINLHLHPHIHSEMPSSNRRYCDIINGHVYKYCHSSSSRSHLYVVYLQVSWIKHNYSLFYYLASSLSSVESTCLLLS